MERSWNASGLSKMFIHTIRPFVRVPTGWQSVSQVPDDNPGQNQQEKPTPWGLYKPLTKAGGSRPCSEVQSSQAAPAGATKTPCGWRHCVSPHSTAPPLASADHHPFRPPTQSISLLTVSPAKFYIRMVPVQLFFVSNQ